MTFPSNVRIISVPSGANVVSSSGTVSGVNHAALAQKIVSTAGAGGTAQVCFLTETLYSNKLGNSLNCSI